MTRVLLVVATFILFHAMSPALVGEDDEIRVGTPADSVYADVWRLILQEAGIAPDHVVLSSALRRGMFVRGEIQMDCCQAQEWRQRPEEQTIQVFTDPFFFTEDHIVVRENAPVERLTPQTLINYRVATVFDHTYVGSEFFGATVTVANTREALRAVANNEADVAITNEQDFRRLKQDDNLQLKLVGLYYRTQIRARIHKDLESLLPDINAAIKRLKSKEAISQIITHSIEKADVPLAKEDVAVGQSDSQGFSLAWQAILEEAGVRAQFIKVPHARKRRLFVQGLIALDCCVVPIWRARPEEKAVQLFSDVFYEAKEHYVFPKGFERDISAPGDLRSMRVAVIRGFDYHYSTFFGETLSAGNVAAQMDLLEARRAHVAIISGIDYRREMFRKPRDLALGGVNLVSGLRIRVHQSKAHLLPRINEAIASLKENGTIEALIHKAIETP